MTNDVIAGRYELGEEIRLLGGSADASLWAATDISSGRTSLVYLVAGPNAVEAADAGRRAYLVENPALASVMDVGTDDDGTTYVAFDRPTDPTLEELVIRHGPLRPETARTVIGTVAQGVEAARRRGLRHEFLAPDRVRIGSDGNIEIFGSAIESAAAGHASRSSRDAAWRDAESLVALLYYAVTGERVHPGERDVRPVDEAAERPLPPDLSEYIDAVMRPRAGTDDRMLPLTAGDVAEALGPWQSYMVTLESFDPHAPAGFGRTRSTPTPVAPADDADPSVPGPGDTDVPLPPIAEDPVPQAARGDRIDHGQHGERHETQTHDRDRLGDDHRVGGALGDDIAPDGSPRARAAGEMGAGRAREAGNTARSDSTADADDTDDTDHADQNAARAADSGESFRTRASRLTTMAGGAAAGASASAVASFRAWKHAMRSPDGLPVDGSGAASAQGQDQDGRRPDAAWPGGEKPTGAGSAGAGSAGAGSAERGVDETGLENDRPLTEAEVEGREEAALTARRREAERRRADEAAQRRTAAEQERKTAEEEARRAEQERRTAEEEARRAEEERVRAENLSTATGVVDDFALSTPRSASAFPAALALTLPEPEDTVVTGDAGESAARGGDQPVRQDAGGTGPDPARTGEPAGAHAATLDGTGLDGTGLDETAPQEPVTGEPVSHRRAGAIVVPGRPAADASRAAVADSTPAPATSSARAAAAPLGNWMGATSRDESGSRSLIADVLNVAAGSDDDSAYQVAGEGTERRSHSVWVLFGAVILLVVLTALAVTTLSSVRRDDAPPAAEPPTAVGSEPASEPTTEEPAPAPPAISTITLLDPSRPEDPRDNPEDLGNLTDGNPETAWETQRYSTPDYGNLKPGIGLHLQLEEETAVTSVTLETATDGGAAEIRIGDPADPEGAAVLTSMPITAGTTTLTLENPRTTEDFILWFPELPPAPGEGGNRLVISGITVS